MSGLIDLHCHWVAGVDDGARTLAEGVDILRKLGRLGFSDVVATPHMRPGLFDNSAEDIEQAFQSMVREIAHQRHSGSEDAVSTPAPQPPLPRLHLSSEHYFDEVVFERIVKHAALPYPGGRAILLEFYDVAFSPSVEQRLFEIQRLGLLPVIAHPERYRPLWKHPERLERLVELGSVALLDACAVTGKYGSAVQRCAIDWLDRELYLAACSDAHRPQDVVELERAMTWISKRFGSDEVVYLFQTGPRHVLAGTRPT